MHDTVLSRFELQAFAIETIELWIKYGLVFELDRDAETDAFLKRYCAAFGVDYDDVRLS